MSARRHYGPAGYPQARTAKARTAERRLIRRAIGRMIDYCLWSYQGGRDWYDRANEDIRAVYGADADLFAALLAATSPQTDIHRNVRLAEDAYTAIRSGRTVKPWLPCHGPNIDRARHGEPLSGHKVRAFAAALCGDLSAIVVDTWMLRAAGFENLNERRAVRVAHEAISRIAERIDWAPAEVQAAVWVGYRNENRRADMDSAYGGTDFYLSIR